MGSRPDALAVNVFVSYSHGEDDTIVAALVDRLRKYRPPRRSWWHLRPPPRLNVYRDVNERATTSLAELDEALARSSVLVVACSPSARASAPVANEIRQFRRLHPEGRIVPVLVRGLANAKAARTGRDAEAAFPDALLEVIDGEPGPPHFLTPASVSPSKRNRDQWYHLLAAIYGLDRPTVEKREFNRRVARTIGWSAAASALGLLVYGAATYSRHVIVENTFANLVQPAGPAVNLGSDSAILISAYVLEQSSAEATRSQARARILDAVLASEWERAIAIGTNELGSSIRSLQWVDDRSVLARNSRGVWVVERDASASPEKPIRESANDAYLHAPTRQLVVAADRRISVIDLETGQERALSTGEGYPAGDLSSCGSQDAHSFVVHWKPGFRDELFRWRANALDAPPEITQLGDFYTVHAVAVSADCSHVASAEVWRDARQDRLRQMLVLRRLPGGRVVAATPAGSQGRVIRWSPDGGRVAMIDGVYQSRLMVWDYRAGQLVSRLQARHNGLTEMAWSSDSERIATVSHDGSLVVWRLEDGWESDIQGRGTRIETVAWSPNGEWIATGHANGVLKIWRVTPESHSVVLGGALLSRTADTREYGRVFLTYANGVEIRDQEIVRLAKVHVGRGLAPRECEVLPSPGPRGKSAFAEWHEACR